MKEGHINLYSDTQTRPTLAMRQAMFEAKVGDEQNDLDPSINRLCQCVAELVGKEGAVFLPSGTMCNEIAVLVHARPGDEVYAERSAHLINFEGGGPSALAGAQIHPIDGERGIFTAEALRQSIRTRDRYGPRPCLVVVEQTTNLGGGAVWRMDDIRGVTEVAKSFGLATHMDGARLLNAVVASGVSARQFSEPFDSVWVDLSKGLGCPVGAVLAGSSAFIDEAWRWKRRMGGAMRQAGFLAAAGLYALEHHVERLAEDHENARRFGEIISQVAGISLPSNIVETNIVFLDVSAAGISARQVSARLEEQGINIGAVNETVLRAVTHLDVNRAQVEEAGQAFVAVVEQLAHS